MVIGRFFFIHKIRNYALNSTHMQSKLRNQSVVEERKQIMTREDVVKLFPDATDTQLALCDVYEMLR